MSDEQRFALGARGDPTAEPGLVRDEIGRVYVVAPDGTRSLLPGGGGSQPEMAVYLGGTPTTVADDASAQLPFGALQVGTDLLDHTDPTAPTFLAPGCYAVLGTVVSDAPLTPGGHIVVVANATGLGGTAAVSDTANGVQPELGVGATAIVVANAGDQCYIQVYNEDGASSHDFTLYAVVVKIA